MSDPEQAPAPTPTDRRSGGNTLGRRVRRAAIWLLALGGAALLAGALVMSIALAVAYPNLP
jgi:hypothetical protein